MELCEILQYLLNILFIIIVISCKDSFYMTSSEVETSQYFKKYLANEAENMTNICIVLFWDWTES